MRSYERLFTKFGFILSLTLVACGSGGGNKGDGGNPTGDGATAGPPVISNLSYTPMTFTGGQNVTIMGMIDVSDPDGDLRNMLITVVGGGSTSTLDPKPIMNAMGFTSGTLNFTLGLTNAPAGTYTFSIGVDDQLNQKSNVLMGTITGQ